MLVPIASILLMRPKSIPTYAKLLSEGAPALPRRPATADGGGATRILSRYQQDWEPSHPGWWITFLVFGAALLVGLSLDHRRADTRRRRPDAPSATPS